MPLGHLAIGPLIGKTQTILRYATNCVMVTYAQNKKERLATVEDSIVTMRIGTKAWVGGVKHHDYGSFEIEIISGFALAVYM